MVSQNIPQVLAFKVTICILEYRASRMLIDISFFCWFFYLFYFHSKAIIWRRPNYCTCLLCNRACSRAKHHRACSPRPLIEKIISCSRNAPLLISIIARYYEEFRMRSAILRNHFNMITLCGVVMKRNTVQHTWWNLSLSSVNSVSQCGFSCSHLEL